MDELAFRFESPAFLLLLVLALLACWRAGTRAGAPFAPSVLLAGVLRPSRGPLVHRWLIGAGLAALCLALARPQFGRTTLVHEQHGRDLMLVLDFSGSMRYDDLVDAEGQRCDRFAAVMEAARDFIAERPGDRIGLVVFAENALTSCPLTFDHHTLADFLTRLEAQQRQLWTNDASLVGDGTNIGLGIGTALRRLRTESPVGRALVLITDGQHSARLANAVDPLTAARHAAELDVRIYGVGVGNPQGTLTQRDLFGRLRERRLGREQLPDLNMLQRLATLTGGEALAAGNAIELKQVFARIDELETTSHEQCVREDYSDRFRLPLLLGLILIATASLLEPRLRGPR